MLQTGSICPPVGLAGGCSPGGQLQHPLQTCYFQTCPELRPRGSHRAPTSSPSCPGEEAPLPRGFPRGAALCSPLRFAAPHPAHRRLRMMQDAPRCIPNLCPRAQPDLQAARGSLPLGPQKPTQGSSPEPQLISVSLSPRSPPAVSQGQVLSPSPNAPGLFSGRERAGRAIEMLHAAYTRCL